MDGRFGGGQHDSGRIVLVLAIILVVSAVLVAGIWFAFEYFDASSRDIDRDLETPAWDNVRQDALPLAGPEPAEPQGQPSNDQKGADARPSRPGVDPRIFEIADNFNKQFARNPGQETAFTDAYPRRALESWINDRAGIPADRRDHFIDSLIAASREIGEDPMINRIGSVPDRVKSIQDALFAYRDEYLRLAEEAAERTERRQAAERLEREAEAAERQERQEAAARARVAEAAAREEREVAERAIKRARAAIKRGPSLAHMAILTVGAIALMVMLLLLFMGSASKRVQPAQVAPEDEE